MRCRKVTNSHGGLGRLAPSPACMLSRPSRGPSASLWPASAALKRLMQTPDGHSSCSRGDYIWRCGGSILWACVRLELISAAIRNCHEIEVASNCRGDSHRSRSYVVSALPWDRRWLRISSCHFGWFLLLGSGYCVVFGKEESSREQRDSLSSHQKGTKKYSRPEATN